MAFSSGTSSPFVRFDFAPIRDLYGACERIASTVHRVRERTKRCETSGDIPTEPERRSIPRSGTGTTGTGTTR